MKMINSLVDLLYEKIEDIRDFGLRNSLIATALVLFLFLSVVTYYFYSTVTFQAARVQLLDTQLGQVGELEGLSRQMLVREEAEVSFLAGNTLPTGIEPFLEQKLTENNVSVEAGWKEKVKATKWFLDPSFEEKQVSLVFKKISTEQLTAFLQSIYTQPAVVVREIEVNKQPDSLSVNLLISYRYKKA